ncbi:MAG: hypothetical protein DCC75_00780 [Proteobacteria bacterium]|nr:MAG: hypothetical protein DCC75_00780 [Pseudomonadota bacterium]
MSCINQRKILIKGCNHGRKWRVVVLAWLCNLCTLYGDCAAQSRRGPAFSLAFGNTDPGGALSVSINSRLALAGRLMLLGPNGIVARLKVAFLAGQKFELELPAGVSKIKITPKKSQQITFSKSRHYLKSGRSSVKARASSPLFAKGRGFKLTMSIRALPQSPPIPPGATPATPPPQLKVIAGSVEIYRRPGELVELNASPSKEGGEGLGEPELTWEQSSGRPVDFTKTPGGISFAAPDQAGVLKVEARAQLGPYLSEPTEFSVVVAAVSGMAYTPYLPDGHYRLADGVNGLTSPTMRVMALNALPYLAPYGFSELVTPLYQGVAYSKEMAANYCAPLISAGDAYSLKYVPGLWLHHIVDNLYGVPSDPPWNITGPGYDLKHPMNPGALIEQRFWDEFVVRARNLALGCQSSRVFVDAEYVFWYHKTNSFWSDANMAAIRGMLRGAIRELALEGIFPIFYHPSVHPTEPNIRRIALGIFKPDNLDTDPLSVITYFEGAPFFKAYKDSTPPQSIVSYWVSQGFHELQVSAGFISAHAADGFMPGELDTYRASNPNDQALQNRFWYSSGSRNNLPVIWAQGFNCAATANPGICSQYCPNMPSDTGLCAG